MKKKDGASGNAGGKDILCEEEQGAITAAADAPSVGKFADAEALLKAYNELESEFTKRSQRLKELERENAELRREQSEDRAESEAVHDETGSAAEERAIGDSLWNGENGIFVDEVERFLKNNPEAREYADEIVEKAELAGEPESGFLDRAYVCVLKDTLRRERKKINDDFILEKAKNIKAVRDEIIRGYLAELYSAKGERLLAGSSGETAIAPPIRPSSIAEAGKMAVSVLKKK